MAFYKSAWFKYFKNFVIGVGAAFVIIGALFKILHWEGADQILMFAMFTEAFIFALQGILPPDSDYYWEKVYPGLNKYDGSVSAKLAAGKGADKKSATKKLDQMFDDAKVDQQLIDRLGSNLRSFGDNLNNLSDVSSVASSTNEYATQAKEAAAALGQVKDAYANAASVASDLSAASEGSRKYHEQVQLASKNLAQLNAVYELELQDTNNHLKAMNKFYGNLTNAIENLNESVNDTKVYKDQIGKLSKNLSALNSVYGNMLSAMSSGASGK